VRAEGAGAMLNICLHVVADNVMIRSESDRQAYLKTNRPMERTCRLDIYRDDMRANAYN
jgi:hypothetical protein